MRHATVALLAGGALILGAGAPAIGASDTANMNTSKKLRAAVSAAGIGEHLDVLQSIADANGGTRV